MAPKRKKKNAKKIKAKTRPKAAKKRKTKKKDSNVIAYVKENKLNVILGAIIFVVIVMELGNFMGGGPDMTTTTVPRTTTLPQYISGKNYIESGEWWATDFNHDLGREGLNNSWESYSEGFGYLLSMNYQYIRDGSYRVTYTMKIANNLVKSSRKVATIEVSQNLGETLVSKDLFVTDFTEGDEYQDFTLEFNTPHPLNDAELRVHYDYGPVNVNIKKIKLEKN